MDDLDRAVALSLADEEARQMRAKADALERQAEGLRRRADRVQLRHPSAPPTRRRRLSADAETLLVAGGWLCSVCTVVNPAATESDSRCGTCGTERSDNARTAVAAPAPDAMAADERHQLQPPPAPAPRLERQQLPPSEDAQLAAALALSMQQRPPPLPLSVPVPPPVPRQQPGRAADAGAASPSRQRKKTWACRSCTLDNDDMGSAQCTACGTTRWTLPLPGLAFGVELELYMLGSRGWTAADIAQVLQRAGIDCRDAGYTKDVTAYWKIVRDRSVRGAAEDGSDLTFELVSPILQGEAGMDEVRRILEQVQRWLGVGVNDSTGLHVHLDARHLALRDLQKVAACFLKYETALDTLVADPTRQGVSNSYCKSNRAAFVAGRKVLSSKQINKRVFSCSTIDALIQVYPSHPPTHPPASPPRRLAASPPRLSFFR